MLLTENKFSKRFNYCSESEIELCSPLMHIRLLYALRKFLGFIRVSAFSWNNLVEAMFYYVFAFCIIYNSAAQTKVSYNRFINVQHNNLWANCCCTSEMYYFSQQVKNFLYNLLIVLYENVKILTKNNIRIRAPMKKALNNIILLNVVATTSQSYQSVGSWLLSLQPKKLYIWRVVKKYL